IQYEDAQGVVEALEKTVKQGLRAGLAINPDTTVAEIAPLLSLVSHVLVMAYPAGFAGQKLQPSIFSKVAELRSLKDSLEIGLDGGVNQATLSKIKKTHFDVVNVNSYLFEAESILTRYHEIIEALS
nr:hypothetical protein [Candidatus Saccharibacteria bacterium]